MPAKDWKLLVRIRTTKFMTERGLTLRKDINFLKRGSHGRNILEDDTNNIGADLVIDRILNLDIVKDGVYEVVITNEMRDYWTGHIEDWDYALIPCT